MNDLKKVLERRTAVPAWSISTLDSDGSSAPAAPRDYGSKPHQKSRQPVSWRERHAKRVKSKNARGRSRHVAAAAAAAGPRAAGREKGEMK